MNKIHIMIIQHLYNIFNKMLFLEKKRIIDINGVKLFPSEIHLMIMAKLEQSNNVTRMAEKLGVTKGAVSQIISRLVKKGIINTTKDPYNKNEMTIHFTGMGKIIINQLLELKRGVDRNYDNILSTFNENECNIINNFLVKLDKVLDRLG